MISMRRCVPSRPAAAVRPASACARLETVDRGGRARLTSDDDYHRGARVSRRPTTRARSSSIPDELPAGEASPSGLPSSMWPWRRRPGAARRGRIAGAGGARALWVPSLRGERFSSRAFSEGSSPGEVPGRARSLRGDLAGPHPVDAVRARTSTWRGRFRALVLWLFCETGKVSPGAGALTPPSPGERKDRRRLDRDRPGARGARLAGGDLLGRSSRSRFCRGGSHPEGAFFGRRSSPSASRRSWRRPRRRSGSAACVRL